MSRTRLLHPELYRHEDLAQHPYVHRLLFAGLGLIADREGRLEDRPKRIKADLFPYDDGFDVDSALADLHQTRFIVRYQVDGKRYIAIPGFRRWQHPHPKEKASEIPEPGKGTAEPVASRVKVSTSPSVSNSDPDPDPDPISDPDPPIPPKQVTAAQPPKPAPNGAAVRGEAFLGNTYSRLKAYWLESFAKQRGEAYIFLEGDARNLKRVAESGLPEDEIRARLDRFFDDPWCQERAALSLLLAKLPSLVKPNSPRAPDAPSRSQEARDTDRRHWMQGLTVEQKQAYWKAREAIGDHCGEDHQRWDQELEALDQRYRETGNSSRNGSGVGHG